MGLTPADIKNWEFGKAFRGYQVGEVDEFVALVLETLENFVREREKYKQEIENLQDKLNKWESKQEEVKKIIRKARQEAAQIRTEARVGAQRIIDDAERKANKQKEKLKLYIGKSKGELYELHTLKNSFKRKLFMLLENQKKLLEEFEHIYESTRLTNISNSLLGSIVTNPTVPENIVVKKSKHKRIRERGKNVSNSSES